MLWLEGGHEKEEESDMTTITVNPLAEKPTKLWSKLKVKQKQKKLPIEDFTSKISEQPVADGHVRFVFISDTHNQTDDLNLPTGDILVHAGDFTMTGLPGQVDHFNEFLGRVKHNYKHVVVIAGNHEVTFNPDGPCDATSMIPPQYRSLDHRDMKKKLTNCNFIEDETVEVMGFKIYGSPW